jgi:triphosphoribosyl-dephospho-CoA synthase
VRPPLTEARVAKAFLDACLAELDALKPGNVHRHGDDPRMSVADFETSARVAAPALAQAGTSVGERIRASVGATIAAVSHNTNLGIVLLSAPLAAAAERDAGDLRARVAKVLAGLSVEDARDAYAAIRQANPGGLGEVPLHRVQDEPDISLLEAMRAAQGHDRIAWNYSHDFADIFERGVPKFEEAVSRAMSPEWAATSVYLGFLATVPDTLIRRKFGAAQAIEVQEEAKALAVLLAACAGSSAAMSQLKDFDRSLKRRGLNPGTSADLTVATLFATSLQALETDR